MTAAMSTSDRKNMNSESAKNSNLLYRSTLSLGTDEQKTSIADDTTNVTEAHSVSTNGSLLPIRTYQDLSELSLIQLVSFNIFL